MSTTMGRGKPKYFDKTKAPRYNNRATVKKVDKYQDKKIKQLEKKVNALEDKPEVKYSLQSSDGTLTTTTPQLTIGPLIDNGNDIDDRIGNKITMKWMEYRARVGFTDVLSLDTPFSVRVIILWDKRTNGNVLDTFFLNTTTSPSEERLANSLLDDRDGITLIQAPYYYDLKDRFTILHDKTYITRQNYPEERPILYINKTLNLHNALVEYNLLDEQDDGGALLRRSIRTVLILQDNGNASAQQFIRFFFTDV